MSPVRTVAPIALGLTVLSMTLPPAAVAQVCFRGQPRPKCSGFAVLEVTMGARLNQTGPIQSFGTGSPIYVSWSAGYLHNTGPRSALGLAVKVAADDDGHHYGPVLRYRQWLGPTWSVDLSLGLLLAGQRNPTTLRFPSATAEAAINWGDRLSVVVGVDQLRSGQSGASWAGYSGLRFGTWLAPLATLGMVIVAGATYN